MELPAEIWSNVASRDKSYVVPLSRVDRFISEATNLEYHTLCQEPIRYREAVKYINDPNTKIFVGYRFSGTNIVRQDEATSGTFIGEIIDRKQSPAKTSLMVSGTVARIQISSTLAGESVYNVASLPYGEHDANLLFTFDFDEDIFINHNVELDFKSQYDILSQRQGCIRRLGINYAKNEILKRVAELEQNSKLNTTNMLATAHRLQFEGFVHGLTGIPIEIPVSSFNYYPRLDDPEGTQSAHEQYNRIVFTKLREYYQNL